MLQKVTRALTKPAVQTVKEEASDFLTKHIPAIAGLLTLGILLLCSVPQRPSMVINVYLGR